MHRVAWSMGPQALSWLLPNGAHSLPEPVVASTRLHAIVLIDGFGFLIGDDTIHRLTASQDVVCDTWRFSWTREPSGRPTMYGFERTRLEERSASSNFVRIFDEEGRELVFGDGPLIVGRHRSCDVPTVDKRVSLFHCALLRTAQGIDIVDLGSRNGTFLDDLRVTHARVVRHSTLRVGRRHFELRVSDLGNNGAVSHSPNMQALDAQIARIAPSSATLMIQGESGVGKELVARSLHRLSGRAGPFIAINAAVITQTLASSELFGHVRGAFTGADSDRVGAFAAADGGTLFLDEVAELSLPVQAELLRAVEQRAIRRVGESIERAVDVRLVVATHRRLEEMVRAGTFREDLYHRLGVIILHVPPLRERPEDLLQITERFLKAQAPVRALTDGALRKLREHSWPGNVRELLNTLRRACIMSDATTLTADDIALTPRGSLPGSLDHLIHDAVIAAYEASGRSTAATARTLGLQRRTVHRLVRATTRAAYVGRR